MFKLPKKLKRFQLVLMFAFMVFIIMLLAILFLFLAFLALSYTRFFDMTFLERPLLSIFIYGIISVLIGTILAVFFSRLTLAPIREIISAFDRLGEGDFSARIHLTRADELKRLSMSFNNMAEELGSIEMLRSDFINNFSHEFKTPIVSMRGFAKILKYNDLSKEEHDEYLDIIINESERLADLSTKVLNLSKIENQTIVTDKVRYNISEQIRRVIALLENSWTGKNIEISFACDEIFLYGNEELLKQVWINLIDNAIKFSPENSVIVIRVMKKQKDIIFTISDQGNGMNPEAVRHVFDRFYQEDSSHATKGNGLGLTLAKKIVELHNGNIQVVKTDSSGTTFEVCLPSGLS